MVPGLEPMEAVDRLKKFQQLFEVRKRKWESYIIGEELFGLAVTQYPELEATEKEILMLDRLYSLYVNVITTVKGYGEYLWVDVVEKIDEMSEQVRGPPNCRVMCCLSLALLLASFIAMFRCPVAFLPTHGD